jgi:hypothetical protein
MLGYAGNLLDLPGASVRDLLSGNNPFDQWATPFSSDNRASGRDVLRPFLGDNEETGVSGWVSNPMEGVKDIAGFWLEMVADPLNFVSLSPLWRALKGRKAVKGANAAQEAANAGRYGYVNPKLLADDMLGGADDAGGVLDEVANPMVEQAGPKLLGYTSGGESWRYPGRETMHHGGHDMSASATASHPYGKFDLSRIKTGEGNNVYGPGAYKADESLTSAGYRDIVQEKLDDAYRSDIATMERYYTPGQIVEGYSGPDKVLQFTKNPEYGGSWEVMVQRVDGAGNPIPGEKPRIHATTPTIKQLQKVLGDRPKARLYTYDAPAGTKARFLDWDAPLSGQPPAVQALVPDSAFPEVGADVWKELDDLAEMRDQFRTMAREQLDLWGSDVPMDKFRFETMGQQIDELDKMITAKQLDLFKRKVPDKLVWSDNPADEMLSGEDIADQLMGGLPSEATLADTARLREAGVPGIKNLANSTGKTSYNYVIWDPELLDQMRVRAIDGQEVPINPMFGPVKAEQRVIPQIADSPLVEVVNPMAPQPLPGLAKPAMQGAAYQALARFNSYGGSL